MDRLFLDANVLFSAAYRPNPGLLKLWKLKNVILCSSRHALEEARINLTHEVQRSRLARLSRNIHLFDAPPKELPNGVLLPDKDVPILLAAIEARATSHYRRPAPLWALLREENPVHPRLASGKLPEEDRPRRQD